MPRRLLPSRDRRPRRRRGLPRGARIAFAGAAGRGDDRDCVDRRRRRRQSRRVPVVRRRRRRRRRRRSAQAGRIPSRRAAAATKSATTTTTTMTPTPLLLLPSPSWSSSLPCARERCGFVSVSHHHLITENLFALATRVLSNLRIKFHYFCWMRRFSCGAMVARLTSNQKAAGSSPASGKVE